MGGRSGPTHGILRRDHITETLLGPPSPMTESLLFDEVGSRIF